MNRDERWYYCFGTILAVSMMLLWDWGSSVPLWHGAILYLAGTAIGVWINKRRKRTV